MIGVQSGKYLGRRLGDPSKFHASIGFTRLITTTSGSWPGRDPVSLITRRPTTGRPATRSGKIKAPPVPAGLISLAVERGGGAPAK